MKPAIDLDPFKNLVILCNGCGEPMRNFGEWPVCFPKPDTEVTMNVQQAIRYSCATCRTPHENYNKGVPVMVSILGKSD